MRMFALIVAIALGSPALAADPPRAPASVFAPSRVPGQPIDQVVKAFPSARDTSERCHHEAVQKAKIDCTRMAARSGNLGFQLEFNRAGLLIRSAEYVIVGDAAEGQRLYRKRVEAMTRAFGKGRERTSTPSAGLSETRTAWTDKPARYQRAGVVLITRPGEPALVLDYLESIDPALF